MTASLILGRSPLQAALDGLRWVLAVQAFVLLPLLVVRIDRWRRRFHEAPHLHICCFFLLVVAGFLQIERLGQPLGWRFVFTFIGVTEGWAFIIKMPAEKTVQWRAGERPPPDWRRQLHGDDEIPDNGG